MRGRVRQRLQENAEVVGADEAFFEDDAAGLALWDLYNEKSGVLDGDEDSEVDLSSYAYQIWKNATDQNPELAKLIPALPNVVFSAKNHKQTVSSPAGVLVYAETPEGNDAHVWMDKNGNSASESQLAILKAAECLPDTPAIPRADDHHELVAKGVHFVAEEEKSVGGHLGRPSGARFRTYERLKTYAEQVKGTLFDTDELNKALEEVYKFPLRPSAVDVLNRQLRLGIDNETLVEIVIGMRADGRLCQVRDDEKTHEPRIICSLGLVSNGGQ